jgi:hypothetical protein
MDRELSPICSGPAVATEWTDAGGGQWTTESFLEKLDWEGGVEGMLEWGGPSVFPPKLRRSAQSVRELLDAVENMESSL